jgi:NitT/TauT family transport system substrate-binding protein
MILRLYATMKALFYAPFYVAHALAAYEAEGLDVRLSTAPHPDDAVPALLEGRVDVTWGGPIDIMSYYEHHHRSLIGFCEVVARDPFFLVGREPNPKFRFADLLECRFSAVSEVETPWLCLQEDIRRAGIDPAQMAPPPPSTMAMNVNALKRGDLDVIQVFEPYVEDLVRTGNAHVWYAAATRGLNTYTTLFTMRETFAKRTDALVRMTRAIYRAQHWFHSHTGHDIAKVIAAFFPEVTPEVLTGAIHRYKALNIWGRTPIHTPVGFLRLKTAVLAGDWIKNDVPFETCLTTDLAKRVVAEAPSPL